MSNLISDAVNGGRENDGTLPLLEGSRSAVVHREFTIQRDPRRFGDENEREHQHEATEIGVLFDQGVGVLACADVAGGWQEYRLVAPTAYVVPARMPHFTRWESKAEVFCSHIKPSFWRRPMFRGAPTTAGALPGAARDLIFWEFASLLRHVWDERRDAEDRYALVAADGLLMRAGQLSRGTLPVEEPSGTGLSQSRRARIDEFIDRQIRFHLHAPDLARAVGLSVAHLTAVLKHSTGMTPHGYITQQRMQRAHQFLASGNYSLREVANAVGYEDPDHFSKKFKEYFGYPPRSLMMRGRNHAQKIPEKP